MWFRFMNSSWLIPWCFPDAADVSVCRYGEAVYLDFAFAISVMWMFWILRRATDEKYCEQNENIYLQPYLYQNGIGCGLALELY